MKPHVGKYSFAEMDFPKITSRIRIFKCFLFCRIKKSVKINMVDTGLCTTCYSYTPAWEICRRMSILWTELHLWKHQIIQQLYCSSCAIGKNTGVTNKQFCTNGNEKHQRHWNELISFSFLRFRGHVTSYKHFMFWLDFDSMKIHLSNHQCFFEIKDWYKRDNHKVCRNCQIRGLVEREPP